MNKIKTVTMESNKLIAEFMGKEHYPKFHHSNYHKSWDWLIPVVAKITRDIRWRGNKYREYLMDIVPLGNIEYAYSAVVDFIEEYNQNQNKDE